MTTDKRKAQYREATRKNREKQKAAGFKRVYFWIKPEWRKPIMEFIKSLKGN